MKGEIRLYPEDINIVGREVDPMYVRLRIGMVFQKPNPFPKSVYENVASGLWVRGVRRKSIVDERVELGAATRGAVGRGEGSPARIRRTASPAVSSSGSASRARSRLDPEIILLDEPTSALDPIATSKIEELIDEISSERSRSSS